MCYHMNNILNKTPQNSFCTTCIGEAINDDNAIC
jgi:hypothetical protein